MSDQKPENENNPSEASPPVDPARRKLTGAALGAGAVFTLSSRPVWANQCSVSGMASGNLSRPGGTPCGGCTPGYWKVCQHLFAWDAARYSPTQTFNSAFGVTEYVDCNNKEYTLLDVMYLNGGKKKCNGQNSNLPANPSGPPDGCTQGTAFPDLGGDPVSPNLGFHAAAALLNAAHDSVNYGYEPGDITKMFRDNYKADPEKLKNIFDMLNNRGCPLGSDPDNRNLR